MILVDTSVLIDYFRGSGGAAAERFNAVLERGIPFGINNYIYQEILQGAAGEREFATLQEYLSTQRFYDLLHGRESYERAARLYFRCRKKGLTIRSTIDFLIAQTAIEHGLMLLHNDADFDSMVRIIRELKIY